MKHKNNSNEPNELLASSKHVNNNNNNNAEDFLDEMIIEEEEKETEQLPPELHDPFNNVLFNYLSNVDLRNFSEACKNFRKWAAPEMDKRAAPALLRAVLQGAQTKAENILQRDPNFLVSINEATDLSGRPIKNLTPFQAALCAGDVEMCEMMRVYFLTLKDGEAELQSQFDAIFPNGLEAHSQTQQENIFDFNEILQAIINAPDNEVTAALNKEFDNSLPLHKALEKFRQAFTEKSLSETVFNPYHLLRAFQTHTDNFFTLGNSNKQYLFWRQVIGFAERYLPACYLQAFAQGLYYIVYEREALRRSFDFRAGVDAIIPFAPRSGLGYGYAVGTDGPGGSDHLWHSLPQADRYFAIMSSKNMRLGKITQPIAARADQVVRNSLK